MPKKRNEEPEWDSESESGSEESGFDDEGSDEGSESGSSEGSESEEDSDDESEEGSDESSEYSSDSGADESMESMEDVGFPDEKVSRGSLFNEPTNKPKWAKLVPSKIVDKGLSYAAIFCACICLIPLALIIGLSVGLTRGGDDDGSPVPAPVPAPTPGAPTTVAPTVAPTIAEIVEATVLTSEVSTTIFRDGVLVDVAVGDEGLMLVQNPPPGDVERSSAYSLVQFDGIVGVDSDVSSEEEYLNSIADLKVDFCLSIAEVSDSHTYTTCLLPPDSPFADVDELTGATAPSYSIPGDCLNEQVVTFDVTPSDMEVCVDIAPLLTYKADDNPALRRRRQLAGTNVKYLLMIDALEESDKKGTRFYSSQASGGRSPTLSIEGKNTCLTAVAAACRKGFRVLCSLVKKASLEGYFGSDGFNKNKTVFAPLDTAFEYLDEGLLDAIEDPEILANVLKHHVVPEKLMSTDLECNAQTNMEVGSTTTLCGDDIYQVLGGVSPGIAAFARIVQTDIETCYGVVHAIDQVLVPPAPNTTQTCIGESTQTIADLCEQEEFSTLCSLVTAAGFVEIFSSGLYTIFAPTNDAFEKALAALGGTIDFTDSGLVTEVVLQHIIAGSAIYSEDLECDELIEMANGAQNFVGCVDGEVFINGPAFSPLDSPKVSEVDIEGCNFVVHRVDDVIIPSFGDKENDDDEGDDDDDDGDEEGTTLTDFLSGDSDTFSSFLAFIEMADLVEDLENVDFDTTTFVPDNDAVFNLISSAPDLANWMQQPDWINHLQDFVLHHVVGEKLPSSNITDGKSVETLNGESIDFMVNKNGRVFINGKTRVESVDAEVANGFVHTLEAVLLPKWAKKSVLDVIGEIPSVSTFSDFLAQANLPVFNEEGQSYTIFAPTNDAIQNTRASFAGTSVNFDDIEKITEILNQHIVRGVNGVEKVIRGDEDFYTAAESGLDVEFTKEDYSDPTVNGIEIIETDILANNGIIYLIEGVILPSCSICSGSDGEQYAFDFPDSKVTIPEGIDLPEIEEGTCTEVEQLCQSGFCTRQMCGAFAEAGAEATCGCKDME